MKKWNDAVETIINDFLADIDARMARAGRPEDERREVRVGLREQLEEHLADDATPDDAERVLTTLDPPASYGPDADNAEKEPPAATPPPRRGGCLGTVVGLLIAAVLFLGAALFFTGRALWRQYNQVKALEAVIDTLQAAIADPASLQQSVRLMTLRNVAQVDFTENREVYVRLRFSARPDLASLQEKLHFHSYDADGACVTNHWTLAGREPGGHVVVATDRVAGGTLHYVIDEGLLASTDAAEKAAAADADGLLDAADDTDGVEPSARPFTGEIAIEDNLVLREIEAVAPFMEDVILRARFNQRLNAEDLRGHVEIEPAVDWWPDEEARGWWWDGAALRGKFTPGEIYTITYKKGLRSTYGGNKGSLAQDVVRKVQIPEMASGVEIATTGGALSPEGRLHVPVAGVRVDRVQAKLYRVYENVLSEFARRGVQTTRWGDMTIDFDLLDAPRTNTFELPPAARSGAKKAAGLDAYRRAGDIDLRALSGDEHPCGAYYLELVGQRGPADDSQAVGKVVGRLLLVSDLAIHARRSDAAHEIVAWVNSLRDGTAATDVSVTLWSAGGQALARAMTDADGLVRLTWTPIPAAAAGGTPVLLTARNLSNGDVTYLDLSAALATPDDYDVPSATYLADAADCRAAVWTDRGIYRPQDILRLRALVRDAALVAPRTPFPVVWRVRRPDGLVAMEKTVTIDANGAASADWELPEYLPTGRYTARLAMPGDDGRELGGVTFALEEFLPPQLRVEVAPQAAVGTLGDEVRFDITARYLFGTPAAGLPVKASVAYLEAPFAPAGFEGWTFGDKRRGGTSTYEDVGSGHIDGDGKACFAFATPANLKAPARIRAMLSATVTDNAGRSCNAIGSMLLDPVPAYVGLRPAWEGAIQPAHTALVEVVVLAPDGSAPAADAAPKALLAILQRVLHTTTLRRNANGKYEWIDTQSFDDVAEDTILPPADPAAPVRWTFVPDNPGEYLLTVRDPSGGACTTLPVYVGGDGEWNAWSRERPGTIRLRADRDRYAPGDVATIHVEAPFAGHALLTVESDRVLSTRVLDLPATTATLEVPVPTNDLPNVYVALTLIRPAVHEPLWTAHRATGLVSLPIARDDRRIGLAVEAPARARPSAPLDVVVRATWPEGVTNTPDGAVAALFAVDEGICMLTDFRSPDPLALLLAPCAWGLDAYDPYSDLMPEAVPGAPALAASAIPGGDGFALALRKRLSPVSARRYKPMALACDPAPIGPDGTASFHLDLPEFNGEIRLMAVAYAPAFCGAAATNIPASREIVVQPALPRFLAPGDAAEAPVTLHNTSSNAAWTVELLATAAGPLAIPDLPPPVRIEPGASTNIVLPLRAAEAIGKAVLTLSTTARPEGVGAAAETFSDTIEMPVRPAAGLSTVHTSLKLTPGRRVALPPPATYLPSALYARVHASPASTLSLLNAFDALDTYPYGCCEQTASCAYPYLCGEAILADLPPSAHAPADAAGTVRAAIRRILSMQQANGAFSLWPFSWQTDVDASLYAVQFLVDARNAGYDVPAVPCRRALAWLRDRLECKLPVAKPGDPAFAAVLEACALPAQILAAAGQPDAAWNTRLLDNAGLLTPGARTSLALALIDAGQPADALAVLEATPLPSANQPRDTAAPLVSPVRTAALQLLAWSRLDPDAPAVDRLLAFLESVRWVTTQDNAMALYAIARYHAVRPLPAAAALDLDVTVGDASRHVVSNAFLDFTPDDALAAGIRLGNESDTDDAFVEVVYEGIDSAPAAPQSNAYFRLTRRFFRADGTAYDPAADAPLASGDLLVQCLVVEPTAKDVDLDQLVIDALLPAGWEIENPNLAPSLRTPDFEMPASRGPERHREVRDDRLLVFTGALPKSSVCYCTTLRATIPGTYALPAAHATAMYAPGIASSTPDASPVSVLPADAAP